MKTLRYRLLVQRHNNVENTNTEIVGPFYFFGKTILFISAVFILFKLANYSDIYNPDKGNYRVNYEGEKYSYELAFEYAQLFFRNTLGFSFDLFWEGLIAFQILLLLCAYFVQKKFTLLASSPSLIYLCESIIGTQVRFGVGAALFIFAISTIGKIRTFLTAALVVLACGVHNVFFIILFLILYVEVCRKVILKAEKRERLFKINVIKILVVLFFILQALGFAYALEGFALETKYGSYVNTEYFDNKSVISLIYAGSVFLVLFFARGFKSEKEKFILGAHLALVFAVLLLFKFAILSGRLLILSMYIEPISVGILFGSREAVNRFLGFGLLSLSIGKLISYTGVLNRL